MMHGVLQEPFHGVGMNYSFDAPTAPQSHETHYLEMIFNRGISHIALTAEIEVPEAGVQGVIIAQGGNFGGWSLYAHEGRLRYAYNLVGVQQTHVGTETDLPPGTHQARMEFAYDGGGIGKGGTVTLYI